MITTPTLDRLTKPALIPATTLNIFKIATFGYLGGTKTGYFGRFIGNVQLELWKHVQSILISNLSDLVGCSILLVYGFSILLSLSNI